MYDMSYESTHSQLQFGPKKISKSKIHILPNYEQMNLKTAIVVCQVFWEPIKNRVSPRSVLLEAVYLEALL